MAAGQTDRAREVVIGVDRVQVSRRLRVPGGGVGPGHEPLLDVVTGLEHAHRDSPRTMVVQTPSHTCLPSSFADEVRTT